MNLFIFICQQTLIFLVPLLLVGLGDLFSERSGVLNIALEGIMVFGAFAGIMFIRSASAAMPSWLVLLIAILISILAGILLSSLHAFASIHLKAEQTISSTAIITFATAFCIFYARVMLGTEQVVFRNTFRIDAVPLLSKIPVLGPILFGQWKPWGIALGALFFGLTKTIAASYSVIPFLYNLGIPEAFFKMLPYVATLIVLAFSTKRSNAPGVIGVPYDKSKR